MKTTLFITTVVALTFAPFIANAHGGEVHNTNSYSFGTPAKETDATRTITVEASDDKFTPSEIIIKQGETIKFIVTNTGRHAHDFNIGDVASQQEHAQMMAQMPDMHHGDDDPTTRSINRGETKTIAWTFNKRPADPIEIDCLEPGHYEKGMTVKVTIVN